MTTELQQLHRDLTIALLAAQDAEKLAKKVQAQYDAEFDIYRQQFESEHAELVKQHQIYQDALQVAKKRAQTFRDQATDALTGTQKEGLPDGFKQTRLRTPKWDMLDVRDWCLKNMPFMLTVNEKMFNSFLLDMADENGVLPEYFHGTRIPVYISLTYKASISDKTLIQNAPETRWADNTVNLLADKEPEPAANAGLVAAGKALIEAVTGETVTPVTADAITLPDDDDDIPF